MDRLEIVVVGSEQLQQDVAEILAEMEAEGFFVSEDDE